MAGDYKYPVAQCESLPFPIKMISSLKPKTFAWFFIPFMESPSNFKHFQKKEDSHSQYISENNDGVRVG